MGKHLDSAKRFFGRDTTGLLDGGRYALVHTRSLEFDDLRPYVPGDDVRDIDWKATARSGHVLIKRFVSEKHHKILVIADAGRNMVAQAPSGERKRDVASNVIGAIGLITLRRADEIGMVFGDVRGCVDIRLRRGETHIESMLHRFHHHTTTAPAPSSVVTQLNWVARHSRRRLLIFVVSDEPEVDDGLGEVLTRLTAQHDVMWAMVADMDAIGSVDDEGDGYDVVGGRVVMGGATLGAQVIDAYRRAEFDRREQLSTFLTTHGVPHARFTGSRGIRAGLTAMTGTYARVR
ncbi:hypothetical protein BST36_24940 [Mycolicibacterium moriokaense]|uniref:DUF58 domain-containing protein n=1 Tax=Mycolicibacterium moriokaense TaxID=39691 RepID=A0AAD1H7M9_9MYCO|nr:DUF58 domain-containing protein [Mycolicibacterium moriokaense]MCV7039516.1 DUF58 domain-containing protein [Mycolicibacterium moriokaense]ORB17250.1 hypothetical protein BST36_24940 [Mycolicibacterium moriokaense]BBW99704.1 hypothetical protein MMOR_06410 [Mycolicibacterium moriokaense]